jgi:hypothetical protein
LFITPLWLRRLSGRSDAETQTPPDERAVAAEAAAVAARAAAADQEVRARQLEGRVLVLQQQLQEADVRLKISADARDEALAALAAVAQQQVQLPMDTDHCGPSSLPVIAGASAAPTCPSSPPVQPACEEALQAALPPQAAFVGQLQLALAATTAGPTFAAAPSASVTGSLESAACSSVFGSSLVSGGSRSHDSTPSKIPQGSAAAWGGRQALLPLQHDLSLLPVQDERQRHADVHEMQPNQCLLIKEQYSPHAGGQRQPGLVGEQQKEHLQRHQAHVPLPVVAASPVCSTPVGMQTGDSPEAGEDMNPAAKDASPIWGLHKPQQPLPQLCSHQRQATSALVPSAGVTLVPPLDTPRSRGSAPLLTPRSTRPSMNRAPLLTPRCTTPSSPGRETGAR